MKVTQKTVDKILKNRKQNQVKSTELKEIELNPNFPKQNDFVNSTQKFIAAQCSRRAGKSTGLALRFFKAMETHPKSLCIYLSLTFDSAKSIMWPVLQEQNERLKLGCTFLEGKMIMTHPNGSKLRLYGADQKNFIKRLKGQKSPAIAIDEAQDFGSHLETLIDDVLTPMLSDYADSWLAISGTPGPVPKGYFFDVCNSGKDGYDKHSWTLLDNPNMPDPEAFIDALIKKKKWEPNHPTLLREWRNTWVLDVQALWIVYKEDKNHFSELPKNIKWKYLLGVDWGFKDADALAVLAYSDSSPDTYLVEEILTNKQGSDALAKQILGLMKEYDLTKIVMDCGGGGLKISEDFKHRHGIPVTPAVKTEKQAAVEILNDALRLGNFKAKSNSRFAQDSYLIQIDWDKSTPDKIVIKKNYHSDIIDAALYAFRESPAYYYTPPIAKPIPGSKEHSDQVAQDLFDHNMKRLQREKEMKDNQGLNWETDNNGVPSWNKWED